MINKLDDTLARINITYFNKENASNKISQKLYSYKGQIGCLICNMKKNYKKVAF